MPLVPTEALIATGADSRVIVVGADGSFRPVRVRTGRSSGGRTEVVDGLKGGERVVTSGQFLIDSEASLSGALARLEAPVPQANFGAKREPGERKVLYWYDPMMPDRHFGKPGKSPFMDMQLVPKYADEVAGDEGDMTGAPMHDGPSPEAPQP